MATLDLRIIVTTCAPDRAEPLLRSLLEARLIACGSLLPVTSLYHWEGRLEREPEVMIWMETSQERLAQAVEAIASGHAYTVPKIVTLEADANPPYFAWLQANLHG